MTPLTKPPETRLSYTIAWPPHLRRIAASSWAVEPGHGLSIVDDATIEGPAGERLTRAVLSGGAAGTRYRVTNRVTFADGGGASRAIELAVAGGRP